MWNTKEEAARKDLHAQAREVESTQGALRGGTALLEVDRLHAAERQGYLEKLAALRQAGEVVGLLLVRYSFSSQSFSERGRRDNADIAVVHEKGNFVLRQGLDYFEYD